VFPGIHLVELRTIRPVAGPMPPDLRSDYGVRIYYGLTGEASVRLCQNSVLQVFKELRLVPKQAWFSRNPQSTENYPARYAVRVLHPSILITRLRL
jgi:hypothetical protein